MTTEFDAVVVGSGPNGLTAAALLARAGKRVLVLEATESPGGGMRTEQLTLPGFHHDVCSAVHPFGASSPAFTELRLQQYGLRWLHPEVVLAHPLDGWSSGAGTGAVGVSAPGARLLADLAETAAGLADDAERYERLVAPAAARWRHLAPVLLSPPSRWASGLRAALNSAADGEQGTSLQEMANVGAAFGLPAAALAQHRLKSPEARALLAGCAAHGFLPLNRLPTGAVGMALLAAAHSVGWPLAAGGSGQIAQALVDALLEAGGRIECGQPVRSLGDLPRAPLVVLNLSERNAGRLLTEGDWRTQARYGPRQMELARRLALAPAASRVVKLDYALSGPIPWRYRAARRAGTVHLGGSYWEIAASQSQNAAGGAGADGARFPFTLVTQPSVVDPSRAPANRHVAWAYAHLPYGVNDRSGRGERSAHRRSSGLGTADGRGSVDAEMPVGDSARAALSAPTAADHEAELTSLVEAQIERFAPGFGQLVLARSVKTPADMEAANANYSSGDITGGSLAVAQLLRRGALRGNPYRLARGLYLCSASTPPWSGVHGMAGYHAAKMALATELG